ncbi:MAG: hypothetical protein HY880_05520 [Deltaproteobacteria bacterium]|nr:hypothetical protein [Deltaproteobacteria bacterium]
MEKFFVFLFTFLCLFLSAISAYACDFCLLSQGISPLETVRGGGIRINTRYTLSDRVFHGTDEIHNPGATSKIWTTEFSGFYSLTDTLTVMAVVPFKKIEMDGHVHGQDHEDHDHHDHVVASGHDEEPPGGDHGKEGNVPDIIGDEAGLGDISLILRYTFFKRHTLDTTTTIAGVFGVKFPTGDTDAKTDDGNQYLEADMQLGTGSTDILAGMSLNHAMGRTSLSANLLAAFMTKGETGDKDHEFGDMLNYDITGKYRLYPGQPSPVGSQFFIALGINGELMDHEEIENAEVTDSGGHIVYLSPGLQMIFAPHWIIEMTYQHPIYQNLYGTQSGQDFKVSGGATYLF